MTGLANLVRLHFWNVGEMRQRFDRQVQLRNRLKDELARLEHGLEAERREARRTLDGALAYQTFVAPAPERRRSLGRKETKQKRAALWRAPPSFAVCTVYCGRVAYPTLPS